MKPFLVAISAAAVVLTLAGPTYSEDEALCLDCHEPAEDWEGMSPEEVLKNAMDSSIKRHSDNKDFSEEQLKAMIAALLETPAPE